MANVLYNNVVNFLLTGVYDLTAETLKLALLDEDYIPNANHDFTTIMLNEISGLGYTAGGQELQNVYIIGNDFKADHVHWTAATFECRWAFLYISPDVPVAIYDLGGLRTVEVDIFRVLWDNNMNPDGVVIKLTARTI